LINLPITHVQFISPGGINRCKNIIKFPFYFFQTGAYQGMKISRKKNEVLISTNPHVITTTSSLTDDLSNLLSKVDKYVLLDNSPLNNLTLVEHGNDFSKIKKQNLKLEEIPKFLIGIYISKAGNNLVELSTLNFFIQNNIPFIFVSQSMRLKDIVDTSYNWNHPCIDENYDLYPSFESRRKNAVQELSRIFSQPEDNILNIIKCCIRKMKDYIYPSLQEYRRKNLLGIMRGSGFRIEN
jgi:hypothetical protein